MQREGGHSRNRGGTTLLGAVSLENLQFVAGLLPFSDLAALSGTRRCVHSCIVHFLAAEKEVQGGISFLETLVSDQIREDIESEARLALLDSLHDDEVRSSP